MIDRECTKKLELRCQVRLQERDLECRDTDVKELQDDSERQINLYNELWTAHDSLLMEGQALCSQVTILSSGE